MTKKEIDKFADSNIFEGMTSISALIKAMESEKNDRKIIKILFDDSKLKSKAPEYKFLTVKSHEHNFAIETTDADTISSYSLGNTHGGIIAFCSDRIIQNLSQDNIKENGVYYLLEGIEDPYNFGNALRSIYASGADGIVVSERNWFGAAGVVARASAGTSELIDIYSAKDISLAVDIFKARGYQIVCAGIRDSVDLFDADLKKPLFIIIGGEKRGISRTLLDKADKIVRISYGNKFNGSLSTSATASIIGFEILRNNRR